MSPFAKVTIHTRRGLVILSFVAAVAFPLATYAVGSRVSGNCEGIHKLTVVGADIIDDGFEDLKAFRDEGTITQAQYERGVEQTRSRLRRWNSADCK